MFPYKLFKQVQSTQQDFIPSHTTSLIKMSKNIKSFSLTTVK